MSAIWAWIRNPKNLAVLVAIAGGLGFVLKLKTDSPSTTTQPHTTVQPTVNINPHIHIENNPSNTGAISTRQGNASPPIVTGRIKDDQPKQKPNFVAQHFPVRRSAGAGIPVVMIPGFSVTVASIVGFEGRFVVQLVSDYWGGGKRSFSVGERPVDITIEGRTYQLSVEAADAQIAEVVLARAKP